MKSNLFFFFCTSLLSCPPPQRWRGFVEKKKLNATSNLLVYFISRGRIMKRRVKGSLSQTELTHKVLHLEGISSESIKNPSQAPGEDTLRRQRGPCRSRQGTFAEAASFPQIAIGHSAPSRSRLQLQKGRGQPIP